MHASARFNCQLWADASPAFFSLVMMSEKQFMAYAPDSTHALGYDQLASLLKALGYGRHGDMQTFFSPCKFCDYSYVRDAVRGLQRRPSLA